MKIKMLEVAILRIFVDVASAIRRGSKLAGQTIYQKRAFFEPPDVIECMYES